MMIVATRPLTRLERQRAMLADEKLARVRREIDAMKAVEKAARVKAEAQQKVQDVQEKARIAEQEWLAKKNREVQARVHNEMAKAISEATGVDCGVARSVTKAIAKGQVPHVTISYS